MGGIGLTEKANIVLTETQKKYLTAVFLLFRVMDSVRMIDVAKLLRASTGAVSDAMKRLREKGLLETTPKGEITLIVSEAWAESGGLLLQALPIKE